MEKVFVNVGDITHVKPIPKTHVIMETSVLKLNQSEVRVT
jgi:hypothetical protein